MEDDHHHEHGHSHRTGPAARYWRDPKAVLTTVLVFFLLFFLDRSRAFSRSRSSLGTSGHRMMPRGVDVVVWSEVEVVWGEGVEVRTLERVETSCEWRRRLKETASEEELRSLKLVVCETVECVAVFARFLPQGAVLAANADVMREVGKEQKLAERRLVQVRYWGNRDALDEILQFVKSVRTVYATFDLACDFGVPESLFIPVVATEVTTITCRYSGDRSCDTMLCLPNTFYRSDLHGCVSGGGPCALINPTACLDNDLFNHCKADCVRLFDIQLRKERVRDTTVAICLLTLFLLGTVLGLLFAKLYWVDPLLVENEILKFQIRRDERA